jgi:hypothetical protein
MAPAIRRGFPVNCLRCGQAGVQVSANDTSRFHCSECDEDFTTADVEHHLNAWRALLGWCAIAPALGADSASDAPAGR